MWTWYRRWLRNSAPRRARRRPARPAVEALDDRTLLAAGTLDPAFGSGGLAAVSFGPGGITTDVARAIALQPDGKIVVAGSSAAPDAGAVFAVARLNPDGSPDPTFGSGGKAEVLFNLNATSVAEAVALEPDGKIVLAGSSTTGQGTDVAVARLDANGLPDASFGNGGKTEFGFAPGFSTADEADAVLVQGDGKIVVAGQAQEFGGTAFAFARLNADGSLDTHFGSGGTALVPFGQGVPAGVAALALQADGTIVAAGHGRALAGQDLDFAVARLNADGSPDADFGTGPSQGLLSPGTEVVPFNLGGSNDDRATGVAVQADGRIVLGGGAVTDAAGDQVFAAARLLPDGSLDRTFAQAGKATVAFSGNGITSASAAGLAVRPDGKVVLGGKAAGGPNAAAFGFAAARLNGDGTLDAGYGSGGRALDVVPDPQADRQQVNGLAVQADGGVLLAGSVTGPARNPEFAVVRFTGDPTPAPPFLPPVPLPARDTTPPRLVSTQLFHVRKLRYGLFLTFNKGIDTRSLFGATQVLVYRRGKRQGVSRPWTPVTPAPNASAFQIDFTSVPDAVAVKLVLRGVTDPAGNRLPDTSVARPLPRRPH